MSLGVTINLLHFCLFIFSISARAMIPTPETRKYIGCENANRKLNVDRYDGRCPAHRLTYIANLTFVDMTYMV